MDRTIEWTINCRMTQFAGILIIIFPQARDSQSRAHGNTIIRESVSVRNRDGKPQSLSITKCQEVLNIEWLHFRV